MMFQETQFYTAHTALLCLLVLLASSQINCTNAFSVQSLSPAFLSHLHYKQKATVTVTSSSSFTTTGTTTALSVTSSGPMSCRPIGIGSAVPHTRLTNAALESVVETSDEWIQTRTGIAARRVLVTTAAVAATATATAAAAATTEEDTGVAVHNQGNSNSNVATAVAAVAAAPPPVVVQSLRDLSIAAAQQALNMANVKATDIDVLICCTSSPDDLFGDAPTIASSLGCTTQTIAFDLTAACSGFLLGMVTAGTFLSNPNSSAQRALVIGADALSRWVDWDDRNACILFGDGAGAMVLERCTSNGEDGTAQPPAGILGYAAHSNGLGHCELNLK
jgi:3-oxoacyl-[acyl-carrier-protein] synthase III